MFERKLAQSVQQEYLEVAEQHRLLQENGYIANRRQTAVKVGLSLITFVVILAVMSQYLAF